MVILSQGHAKPNCVNLKYEWHKKMLMIVHFFFEKAETLRNEREKKAYYKSDRQHLNVHNHIAKITFSCWDMKEEKNCSSQFYCLSLSLDVPFFMKNLQLISKPHA